MAFHCIFLEKKTSIIFRGCLAQRDDLRIVKNFFEGHRRLGSFSRKKSVSHIHYFAQNIPLFE